MEWKTVNGVARVTGQGEKKILFQDWGTPLAKDTDKEWHRISANGYSETILILIKHFVKRRGLHQIIIKVSIGQRRLTARDLSFYNYKYRLVTVILDNLESIYTNNATL